ncbi:MAG: hypothetical protein MUE94_02835 [Verrucomicrobia bacterium]|jgi:hypothetical protein|nr:hypothetical protein [Verrucomicrobiota bacterium]
MAPIDFKPDERVVKRWGFYAEGRLAYGGVAILAGPGEVRVHFFETENHADTASLPERIGREQMIRGCARADLDGALGSGWVVRFEFHRRKLDDKALLRVVFGSAPIRSEFSNHSDDS